MATPEKSHGLSQEQMLEILKPRENMRIWGAVYSHRQACVRYIRDAVFAMLDDPSMTRSRLKRELADIVKRVEEHRP